MKIWHRRKVVNKHESKHINKAVAVIKEDLEPKCRRSDKTPGRGSR